MKALVQNGYGSTDYLSIIEVDTPTPKGKEVLVKVKAGSLNAGDYFILKGSPWMVRLVVGFPKPKNHILGWDAAGVVEAVGPEVVSFKVGDEVYAAGERAFAEYICIDEEKAAFKPKGLSFLEAAAVPTAGVTALRCIRDSGHIKEGQKVLINGASGGVGTFAVQIAKALGAEVTGVCSTRNLEMVRSLGADYVVDYTREDFTTTGQVYDFILDNVSSRKFSELKTCLKSTGKILPNSGYGGMRYILKAAFLSLFTRQIQGMFQADPHREQLDLLRELIDGGKVRPVVDKTFGFSQLPNAFRYMEEEHPRGKIVVNMD